MQDLNEISCVGVVGSGIMGSGLAEVAAASGRRVIVRSRSQESADAMLVGLASSLDRRVTKGRIEAADRDELLARVSTTTELDGLAECDLVIESVVEDMDVKRALFAELDKVTKPDVILASNTSTLPIVEMAIVTSQPDRVCGIHFFNPAPIMKLVEVIRPITASDATIKTARLFAESCRKDPVEVADRAGFVVNALLFPYLNNAIRMCEQGTASIRDIDTAMQGGCNFPMGPFELLDLVGLDTSLAILEALHAEFGDAAYMPATSLKRLVSAGHLGRKTGRGFHTY